MATIGALSEPGADAAGSLGRDSQLLPYQSTLRCGGSHQQQHQNPSEKRPWLQESSLPAAQGPAHGGHKDRIHRLKEGSLKCGSRQILVQSQKKNESKANTPAIFANGSAVRPETQSCGRAQ